ncbi:MAG: PilN domain-containing protein [Nitrospiraceae bacterium]
MNTVQELTSHVQELISAPGNAARPGQFFSINLSGRYRWYVGPARLFTLLLSGLICSAILWDVVQTWGVGQEIVTMQAALDHVREQDRELLSRASQQGLDLSESAIQLLPKEVDFANQLITKRGFSWTRFLAELEQVIPARIAINSIRLDQTNAIVHLTGSALNLEAVTALTVTFQDHPRFKDPVLGQHRDAGNGIVEFDLSLRYKNRSQ